MDVAEYVAQFLRRSGVSRVFGLPGTETIELIEAMRREGLEFVLTHHEATATFAAAMTGHLTGVPGVCLVAGGPGTTNTTSGVFAAHLDRLPLCVLIGDHVAAPGLPAHQRLPFEHVADGVARARLAVQASDVAERLPAVFAAATSPLPGPVIVSIPTGQVDQPVSADVAPPLRGGAAVDVAALVAPLARRLTDAKRVFIVAGLGITWGDDADRLVRLAERLQAPVADTPQSKGWFPNDHPLYVGTIATRRNRPVAGLAEQADIVLAVGLDSVELLSAWPLSRPLVSLAPTNAGEPALPSTVALDAPLDAALDELLARLEQRDGPWDLPEIAAAREEIRGGLWPTGESDPPDGLWPQTVVDELQRALPPGAVVTTDVGSHKLLMVQQWVAAQPNTFLNSSGLASMGTGIPFAIAAKYAWPERTVAAVVGDGGVLMYAGELASVARMRGPLPIVALNDGALSSIRVKQARRGYPPVGTLLPGPELRLAALARATGLPAVRVSSQSTLRRALRRAATADRPMFVEAMVDPRGYEFSQ